MCDVCEVENRDWKFQNGGNSLQACRLYRVYKAQVANIKLCHLCSIELFCIGENRFLEAHPRLAVRLHRTASTSVSDVFAFG